MSDLRENTISEPVAEDAAVVLFEAGSELQVSEFQSSALETSETEGRTVFLARENPKTETGGTETLVTEDYADLPESEPLSLKAQIGSLLFVCPRPLSSEKLSELCEVSLEVVEQALIELNSQLEEEELGFSLRQIAGAFQIRSSARAAKLIHKLIPPKAKRLSKAAAETLAIIAYKQPVSKSEIETIRGVDAIPTLKTLLDARLIRVVGREQAIGKPALYGTTETFLEKFGLGDLSDLPTVREVVELATEPAEDEASEELTAEESGELSRVDNQD